MKLLLASFSSFLHIKTTDSIRLPFPVQIPDGHSELTVVGNLVGWLSENGVSEITNSTEPNGMLRNGGLTLSLPLLTKYGCWCVRGDDYPGGKGIPRDSFDQACKMHHMAFDCIIDDAKDFDPNCLEDANGDYSGCCNPTSTEYSWDIVPNLSIPGDYTIQCTDEVSSDWCQSSTCMVDLKFISDYWELTSNGLAPDFTSYAHPDHSGNPSTFDTADCPSTGGGGGGTQSGGEYVDFDTRVCCGDYPYRFWYLTTSDGSDDRSCCEYVDIGLQSEYGNYAFFVGAMYHENTQACCDDGPKVFGSCP